VSTEHLGALILAAGTIVPLLLIQKHQKATSPLSIIWISQTIPLGIALLNFSGDFPRLTGMTWLLLTGSFLSILLGWIVGQALNRFSAPAAHWQLDSKKLTLCISLLVGMYALSILQGVKNAGNFPLLSVDPANARWIFMTGRLQNFCFSAAVPLFILLLHKARTSKNIERLIFSVVLLALVISYVLIGSRFLTLVWLTTAIVYWDLYVKKLPLFRIALVVLLFTFAFVAVGYFRYGKDLAVSYRSTNVMKVGWLLALDSLYSYIANAYWNTDFALIRWNQGILNLPTWGISSNEGILWIIGFVPGIQKAYNYSNAMNTDITFREGLNATTYHWALFKDFGIAGPLLGSFGMGAVITFFYSRFCRSGAFGPISIYGVLAYFLIGSFNLLPSVIPTPLCGLLLLIATTWICRVPNYSKA
jgi:oligosaccharide repeat unit polymerase